jgi:hypothetical protein
MDYLHLPPDFDCPEQKKIWILCDFNVQDPATLVENIPLKCWRVDYGAKEFP